MKKLICLLMCLCMILPIMAACGETTPVETLPVEDTTPESTPETEEKIPSIVEPHEKKTVDAKSLGMKVYTVKTEKYYVADATTDKNGNLNITSYNPGTTVLSIMNSYGEEMEVTVKVDDNFAITTEYEKFEMPRYYAVATDFGVSTDKENNAEYFQNAIDSLVYGGTLYVPAGTYKTKTISLKDNITIRLEGRLEKYNTVYSSKITNSMNKGTELAVIEAAGGDVFINTENRGWGRDGADNITVTGGVINMNGHCRAFVLACCENFTLENIVMKDCPNDHAIQLTGCINSDIRNVMFAGYNLRTGYTGGEMIQIEMSHPGALGAVSNTPIQFETNEGFYTEDVLVENCYFGASDRFDAPTYALGHHGQQQGPSAKNIKILGCTFDNPRICAIRGYGWSDVEIANCKFTSNKDNSPVPKENRFMLEINYASGDVWLSTGVYLCTSADRMGAHNYNIHDNTFVIGKNSKMSGIIKILNPGVTGYDARAYANARIAEFYTKNPISFTGYKMMTNNTSDMRFNDNNVTVANENYKYIFEFNAVYGLEMNNNKIASTNSAHKAAKIGNSSVLGARFMNCVSAADKASKCVVTMSSGNKNVPIVLLGGEKNIELFLSSSGAVFTRKLTVVTSEGGIIERWCDDDGVMYIEAVADEGYVFDGFFVDNKKIDVATYKFTADTTITARFIKSAN